jgi:predicted transcriptional regulator
MEKATEISQRKSRLIAMINRIENNTQLDKIEKVLIRESKPKMVTLEEFYEKIEQSERDVIEGRVHTMDEVKQQINQWRTNRKA